MARWPFTHGLHDLGSGCYGYLQPDGTWGLSNAGLITSAGDSLLVDTLMGRELTRRMLERMRAKVPEATHIRRLVNTHANPDHVLGNQVVEGAEIIAATATAAEMRLMDPKALAAFAAGSRNGGEAGEFFWDTMGHKFDFSGIDEITPPSTVFDRRLSLRVGNKLVELVNLGPAHTEADTIVYVPADRVVFTGDLLFNQGHPIIWAGPIQNWIRACTYLEGLDVDVVVPGHGPITDKNAVAELRRYLAYVVSEATLRFRAGMSWEEAGRDIRLDGFQDWTDSERIVANVFAVYRGLDPTLGQGTPAVLFPAMLRYRRALSSCA